MDKSELDAQIAKYKSRRLKSRLATYSAFISLFLMLSIFASPLTLSSLVSLLLLLPLISYFARESLKLTRKARTTKERLSTLQSSLSAVESTFSFRQFLTQPSLAFRLTFVLFFVVLFTTLARTTESKSALSMNQTNYTVISSEMK